MQRYFYQFLCAISIAVSSVTLSTPPEFRMQTSIKIIFYLLVLSCLFFVALGLYSLDALLIGIAVLCAVAAALIALEAKDHLLSVFRRND